MDYLKADYWDLREACIWLFGGKPINDDGFVSGEWMEPQEEVFLLALRAMDAGHLRYIGKRKLARVAPADFRDWARANGCSIPEAWKTASLAESLELPVEERIAWVKRRRGEGFVPPDESPATARLPNKKAESKKESTSKARKVKTQNTVERDRDLLEFENKLREGGRRKEQHWALDNKPIPFTREDFMAVFWCSYRHYRKRAPSTMNSVLKKLKIPFQQGTRKGKQLNIQSLMRS